VFKESFVGLFSMVILVGCASSIYQVRLLGQIEDNPARLAVIDVRTASEYRKGHMPGAVNISVFTLPFRIGEIPVESKDEPLVVYCAHGPRAGLAGFILKVAGFKSVYHLEGDMKGWLAEGLPVEGLVIGSDE
jgi:rhodanese-related sulfurtransferase